MERMKFSSDARATLSGVRQDLIMFSWILLSTSDRLFNILPRTRSVYPWIRCKGFEVLRQFGKHVRACFLNNRIEASLSSSFSPFTNTCHVLCACCVFLDYIIESRLFDRFHMIDWILADSVFSIIFWLLILIVLIIIINIKDRYTY